jgi:hypothetical protein
LIFFMLIGSFKLSALRDGSMSFVYMAWLSIGSTSFIDLMLRGNDFSEFTVISMFLEFFITYCFGDYLLDFSLYFLVMEIFFES